MTSGCRVCVCALVLAACGNGNKSGSNGNSSSASSGGDGQAALAGEWRTTGMSEADRAEGVTQFESTFRFNADGTWQETELVTRGESAPTLAACTENSVLRGTFTVQASAVRMRIERATMSRNSCKIESDNRTDAPLSEDELRLANLTITAAQFKWESDTITMSLPGHNDLTLTYRRVPAQP